MPARPPVPMEAAPMWSPARDAAIRSSHGRHALIAELAAGWGVSIARVTARWHVLRVAA